MKPTAVQQLEHKIERIARELEHTHAQYTCVQQWMQVLQQHPDAEIVSISPDRLELDVRYYNGTTYDLNVPSCSNVVNLATRADSDGPVLEQTVKIAPGATLTVSAYFNWEPSDRDLLRDLGNLAPVEPDPDNLFLTCRI